VNDSKNVQRTLALAVLLALCSLAGTSLAGTAAAQTSDDPDAGVTGSSTETPVDTTTPAEPPPADGSTSTESQTFIDGTTQTTTTTTDTGAALGTTDGTTITTTTTTPDGTTTTDSTTVAATNPDEAAEEVQAEREPLAWRNSYFNYSINSSFCTFSRDCQLSYDPVVYTFLSLSPRWYLDPATFFSFYQAFYIEHTDDDGATYQHEFQLFDTRIALNHRESLSPNFLMLVGGSLWLPTSKGSQAAQRYFRLGASVSATWDPGVGGFNLSFQASYVRWFSGSNVAITHSPYAADPAGSTLRSPSDPSPGGVANQASATTSEVDRVSAGITANWQPVSGFTITLQIFYFWLQGWGLGNSLIPGVTTTDGTAYGVGDTSPTHWRLADSYAIYFQYDFLPWFQGWIGLSNSTQLASVLNENGTARSPVALPDLQASLGATITLDSVYETFAASEEDDGLTPEQRQRRRQGLAHRTSTTGGSL